MGTLAGALRRAATLIAAIVVLGVGGGAFAADNPAITPELLEKIRRSNAECFACHSEEGLKNPPRADMDLVKLAATLRDAATFKDSNHGNMECKQCHGQGFAAYPHAEGAAKQVSPCEECHAVKVMKVEKQYFASVHAKNLQDKFTCNTCHEVHRDLVATKLRDPAKIVAQDNHMCLECHGSDLTFAKYAPANKKRPDLDRIHEWLPNAQRHWDAVRCVDCHTPVIKAGVSHEVVGKDKAEKNCVSCHNANSSLSTRLYRHLMTEEQQKFGFVNSVVLTNSYVVGATRHPLLDTIVLGLAGLTVAGLLGHGIIRIVLAAIRRRKS